MNDSDLADAMRQLDIAAGQQPAAPPAGTNIQLGATPDGQLVVSFDRPVKNLIMAPRDARNLAEQIRQLSHKLERGERACRDQAKVMKEVKKVVAKYKKDHPPSKEA